MAESLHGRRSLASGAWPGRGVLLSGALALLMAACSLDFATIQGSGVATSEDRAVGGFERLSVAGSMHVGVTVGPAVSLRLRADDNLMPYVVSEVEGDTLKVHMKSGSYRFSSPLEVTVTVPKLRGCSSSGRIAGRISGLHGGEFSLTLSGSSRIEADGAVDRLRIAISGSGDVDLHDVEAQQAEVSISGSGDARLQVEKRLDARISGSGNIRYRGSPLVSTHISGSGHVGPE